MIIIGADYHPGFQQIAFVDTETGDCGEQRLQHRVEAEKFYRDLAAQGMKVRVGMEASGHARTLNLLHSIGLSNVGMEQRHTSSVLRGSRRYRSPQAFYIQT